MATNESVSDAPAEEKSSRRNFLVLVGTGLNVVAGTLFAIPIVGYLLSGLRPKQTQAWISLGQLPEFPENTTRLATFRNPFTVAWDGPTANIPCWVRRMEGEQFQVFAINCAHLGCPVRWFAESKLFMCPCHGGAYYADGSRASGPPERGLYEYKYKIEDGQLWVLGGQFPALDESA
jgi:Rieske Fe-S protein